ncbi:MAG: S41 family peptidase [Burkholderiaceae bacterium]|jgi:tricorn protease|nr:S41 family peptidase [Burkholderiaceae bacterium]
MSHHGYLRQPTIRGNTIVFVCDDDLWSVSVDGGLARRLTAGLGEPSTPVLSPDGQWLAYASRDELHPEVYVMPADGGPARRLTWLGPFVHVRGWTGTGEIVFVTTWGQPFFRNFRAFTIARDGGLPSELPLGQVNHLALTPRGLAGPKVIGRNTADPARWKRYRGGTAGHLWVDATGGGAFARLPLVGNITSPMWIGDRIYYLSDAEGVGNLYSCRADGGDVKRHTDHADFYAREAQTDGARIVYQCGAELWLYDAATDRTRQLDVRVPAHRAQAARRFVPAAEHLGEFALHPQGHSVALDARGKCYTLPLWEGAVRQHGAADGVRHRHAQWLADGQRLVVVSDASGEERIEVHADGSVQSLPWDIGRVIALAAAPAGDQVAIANHRNEVLVGNLATGTLATLGRSEAVRTDSLAWSPDGAWLAYPFWTSSRHCAIKLANVASGQSTLVTTPEFRDYAPAFDPAGRYLYFLSVRTFDPVYDNVQFELSFPRAARPYLIALQADASPPFEPPLRGMKPAHDEAERKGEGAERKPLRVDLDGIAQRVAAFPVREGLYGQIAGVATGRGKVMWTQFDIPGAHGRGGHKEGPGRLEVFDFDSGRAEMLMDQVERFCLSHDGSTLLVRSDKRLRALDPHAGPEKNGHGKVDDAPSRKSGWLDLGRIRVSVDPRAEWRQMLREVWRLQRDQFWVPDMSGVDWSAVYARYAPLVERVATRAELSDLIWEMQGELGTSHAYEMGGDHRKPPAVALGQFAADFRMAGEEIEIVHIVRGDAWDASADSPLNAIGVQAQPGERVLAVNGQPVTRVRPPQAHAVHQAGCKAELRLKRPNGSTRDVLVTLLADEVPARYREWVERNRAWVHARSGGRVGYLHLPDMQSAGFAEFHRYFAAECDRDALIVDVRYNRGGHVSQLLLEKVARKRIGYDLQRWGPPQPYPVESPAGAVVALTNEHAGSDGDIFSHCFKLMKLGPLVGKRTWGGVIGIWPRHALVDGTETTQPEFSFWFQDVGWQVENYGTDPDIDIDNAPQDAAAGRDRQLEKALEVALERAGAPGSRTPQFGPKPKLACPPLPARASRTAGG